MNKFGIAIILVAASVCIVAAAPNGGLKKHSVKHQEDDFELEPHHGHFDEQEHHHLGHHEHGNHHEHLEHSGHHGHHVPRNCHKLGHKCHRSINHHEHLDDDRDDLEHFGHHNNHHGHHNQHGQHGHHGHVGHKQGHHGHNKHGLKHLGHHEQEHKHHGHHGHHEQEQEQEYAVDVPEYRFKEHEHKHLGHLEHGKHGHLKHGGFKTGHKHGISARQGSAIAAEDREFTKGGIAVREDERDNVHANHQQFDNKIKAKGIIGGHVAKNKQVDTGLKAHQRFNNDKTIIKDKSSGSNDLEVNRHVNTSKDAGAVAAGTIRSDTELSNTNVDAERERDRDLIAGGSSFKDREVAASEFNEF